MTDDKRKIVPAKLYWKTMDWIKDERRRIGKTAGREPSVAEVVEALRQSQAKSGADLEIAEQQYSNPLHQQLEDILQSGRQDYIDIIAEAIAGAHGVIRLGFTQEEIEALKNARGAAGAPRKHQPPEKGGKGSNGEGKGRTGTVG